jgi:hypothetical protein
MRGRLSAFCLDNELFNILVFSLEVTSIGGFALYLRGLEAELTEVLYLEPRYCNA